MGGHGTKQKAQEKQGVRTYLKNRHIIHPSILRANNSFSAIDMFFTIPVAILLAEPLKRPGHLYIQICRQGCSVRKYQSRISFVFPGKELSFQVEI